MKKLIEKIVAYAENWRSSHNDDSGFYYGTAASIGVLAGAGAAAIKTGIKLLTNFMFQSLNIHEGNWGFLMLPFFGLFIAVVITKYLVKNPLDHATERVAEDLVHNDWQLSPRIIWGSIVSCSFTLGLGGSAGAESPVAYVGAAVGSNVGRKFKLPADNILQLVGIGAAAGIAGIYMAPIGGVMYGLEVLRMKQDLRTAIALVFSCLSAALTCYLLLGCHTDVSFVPEMRFDNHLILYVLICGALCGMYSLYYVWALKKVRLLLGRAANTWLRALYGALMLSALLFIFPSLYGEGYGIIGKLMDDDAVSIISYGPFYPLGKDFLVLALLFLVLLAVKPVATSATNDSGGVGGDFTPTFFCGGVLGFWFATILNHYLHLQLPVALFAFFGMAAVMAGSMHAPLMAIFIAAEMTGLYGFILPLTLAGMSSFVTTAIFDRKQIPLLLGHIQNTVIAPAAKLLAEKDTPSQDQQSDAHQSHAEDEGAK